MSKFKQWLFDIRENPNLHGVYSVEEIHVLFIGVELGYQFNDAKPDEFMLEFKNNFQSWIRNYYRIKSTQSWPKIIRFFSRTDEESLRVFFDRLSDFLEKENK